ncbi:hypothetical protein VTO73DRAFT_1282 [Trametes versicolor]
MSFCDKHTLTRIMGTCPTLRREGAKLLLDGHVSIRDLRALVSFIFFIKVHKPAILYHLCSLNLAVGTIHPNLALILVRILAHSRNLQSLSLSHTRDLFASHLVVRDLICQLRSLRHLTLHRCGKFFGNKLILKAPLISLTISYITPEPFFDTLSDQDGPMYHPMLLCASVSPVLESLDIQYSRQYGAVIWKSPYTFSKMRTLVIHDNMPYTAPYTTSFPNLTHLTISTTHQQRGTDLDSGAEAIEDHRTLNETAQSVCGTWSRLEHLTGDVAGLYLLAPSCSVGNLTVAPISETLHLEYLFSVLMDTEPEALDLTMTIALLEHAWPDFATDLTKAGTTLFTSLTLAVSVGPLGADEDEDFAIEDIMDTFINAMRDYKLHSLKLTLYPLPPPGSGPDYTPASLSTLVPTDPTTFAAPPLSPTETSLSVFGILAFVEKLEEAFPSLKFAEIRVVRPGSWKEDFVRLSKGDDGEAILVDSTCR